MARITVENDIRLMHHRKLVNSFLKNGEFPESFRIHLAISSDESTAIEDLVLYYEGGISLGAVKMLLFALIIL
jgi:hypothetical protein